MKINHIGIACRSIERYISFYKGIWNDAYIGDITVNEFQKIKQCFIRFENQITLELLEPLCEASPITKVLNERGEGLYHICYEVADINEEIKKIKAAKGIVVCKPVPDVAFNGKLIAFAVINNQLSEFLQVLNKKILNVTACILTCI